MFSSMRKNHLGILFGLFAIVFSAGCVSPPEDRFFYTPPKDPGEIPNQITVKESFTQVWDSLIGELSKSYFVINNVEKASRIINLSFSTNEPENFLDCGTSRREHSFMKKVSHYDYQVAGDSEYKIGGQPNTPQFATIIDVQRKTSLSGRINVYIAPVDKSDTQVSVNARYVLSIDAFMTAKAVNGAGNIIATNRIPNDRPTVEIAFNTNTEGKWNADADTAVYCYSNGKLETSILDLVKSTPSN